MSGNFVPVYSRRPRTVLDQVIEADTPEVVRMTTPAYLPYYLQPQPSYISDDLHYRMRPNLESVVKREYSQYGPLDWSWSDFTRARRDRTPSYSGRDGYRTAQSDRPLYNKYLTSDSSPATKSRLTMTSTTNTRSSMMYDMGLCSDILFTKEIRGSPKIYFIFVKHGLPVQEIQNKLHSVCSV